MAPASSGPGGTRDEALLRVLARLGSQDLKSCALVCRRWLVLCGQATSSLRLLEWDLLARGRMARRFPGLTSLDLTPAWSNSADAHAWGPAAVFMTRGACSMRLDPRACDPFHPQHRIEDQSPSPEALDAALRALRASHPHLRSLHLVDVFRPRERRSRRRKQPGFSPAPAPRGPLQGNTFLPLDGSQDGARGRAGGSGGSSSAGSPSSSGGSSPAPSSPRGGEGHGGPAEGGGAQARAQGAEEDDARSEWESVGERRAVGLEILGESPGMPWVQELTVRQCMDSSLDALSRCASGCPHLQVLRLVGALPGFYHAAFSDKGLRKLPRGCPRLLELHLEHGDVGLEGLAAVGQGCPMLSELHLGGSSFGADWIQALCLFPTLHSLHLRDFAQLDPRRCAGGSHGVCPSLRQLTLTRCDLSSLEFSAALLRICRHATRLALLSCRGLTDQTLHAVVQHCRHLKTLELEGCPAVTTAGLEAAVMGLKELESLRVSQCAGIKDQEMIDTLADAIFSLKVLKWEPAVRAAPKSMQKENRAPLLEFELMLGPQTNHV